MKFWLARTAALALTAGLAACGGDAASTPTPTPTLTPTRTPTSTSASTPAPLPTGRSTSASDGVLGPFVYPKITNTNGYNTYVANNMWAAGGSGMTQTLTAADPGKWYIVAKAPARNTAVLSYPNTQQLFNNWSGGGWNGGGTMSDTPISRLKQLESTFAENMNAVPGTNAEAAYDVWLSGTSGPTEIMIWIDNANRGTGGADQIGTGTFGDQKWTLLQYHGGEIIWSSNANKQSGTVDILAMLRDLQSRGLVSSGAAIGQIDFGFEICSTGGAPETFSVSHYSLTAK
jgi:Glycosyl hydrolase family 12